VTYFRYLTCVQCITVVINFLFRDWNHTWLLLAKRFLLLVAGSDVALNCGFQLLCSRGIGLAIALRCAKDGANIAILAKTASPQPNLPGTIYSAAEVDHPLWKYRYLLL